MNGSNMTDCPPLNGERESTTLLPSTGSSGCGLQRPSRSTRAHKKQQIPFLHRTPTMRLLPFVTLAAYMAVVSGGSPLAGRAMAVHESVKAVPNGFARAGAVASSETVTLRIALAHTDIGGLERATYDVSTPSSTNYGKHLSPEKIAEYVKPTAETLSAVKGWLDSHGIAAKSISFAGDVLEFTTPVKTANTLLAADFMQFTHIASGKKSVRTLKYSVPVDLQSRIKFIHPTVAFVSPLKRMPGVAAINHVPDSRRAEIVPRQGRPIPESCSTAITPVCLQAFYGVPAAKANNSSTGNVLAVAGYIDEFANEADLTLFLEKDNPALVGTTFTTSLIDGGRNEQTQGEAGVEAGLDIQYTVGVAGGVPVTFISVGPDNADGIQGFVDITNHILSLPVETRPTVLTTSYGFNEPELPIELNTQVYASPRKAMCNAYMQLGAAGVSVLFSSGDGGVAGAYLAECTEFVPTAPVGCPFITSVGGITGLPPQRASLFSSGGFSNHFAVPDYQRADVESYKAGLAGQYAGLYNTSGRGYPDIAIEAQRLEMAYQGEFELAYGTSAASPVAASIFALVNDRLIAAGKPVLGFLNPFLYSAAGQAGLTDITIGHNLGCDTDGFAAKEGWDPVTGLGSPDFDRLLAALGL
ncbi:Tripeptidyl-peptidase sed3 [Mycena indigotica]|uniref:tripeptidyl-peptidase II n=1 Tax=Mycena indigotica TaxID=2126181 RepID=A0A8H6SDC8_9AGAR|nr:Tripeptidyl-peptidase sed3 [Mycena indigotica]KAF7296873.1 Tripeptidyl-peptidase sed3 [Mycena indigotica]